MAHKNQIRTWLYAKDFTNASYKVVQKVVKEK